MKTLTCSLLLLLGGVTFTQATVQAETISEETKSALVETTKTLKWPSGKAVEVSFEMDTTGFEEHAKILKTIEDAYFDNWETVVKLLNAPEKTTPTKMTVKLSKTMRAPAAVSGTKMAINMNHVLRDPGDLKGMVMHELTHVIQNYKGDGPIWFTEGVADWVRYKITPNTKWGNYMRENVSTEKPLGAYWYSSCFLMWMEETYNKPIIATVSAKCSQQQYDVSVWKELTGKNLDQLTAEFKKSGWHIKAEE